MRRVLYDAEWQGHARHIHLMALPDFLGFGNAIDMAKKYPALVRRGLRLRAETVIRNDDPRRPCAAHVLRIKVRRR